MKIGDIIRYKPATAGKGQSKNPIKTGKLIGIYPKFYLIEIKGKNENWQETISKADIYTNDIIIL